MGYTWSFLTCKIGHCIHVWEPIIGSAVARSIATGALGALAFCHDRGVTHGSLGAASVLLSHFEDRCGSRSAPSAITEMNRIDLVLFVRHNRKFGTLFGSHTPEWP
jgi:hypothetical protein